jgi:hypothetical protein
MNSAAHRWVTEKVFQLLGDIDSYHLFLGSARTVIEEACKVDDYEDVELVDVEGLGIGRDDPHDTSFWDIEDQPHYRYEDRSFTAFNHFIDIKKGPGLFDDYDGYSYRKGSASRDEYQKADDVVYGFWQKLFASLSGKKVDEGLNWWFNDEYVHAPGQPWYRGCSPAVERYSFPEERGIYSSKKAELQMRFPLAESTGQGGMGIPYSVFMPVDNMARYWYSQFFQTRDPVTLGPVMHAIQDASIPHHAAGYNGNWHARYEADLDTAIGNWFGDPNQFNAEVKTLYAQWNRLDPSPPNHLNVADWVKVPASNWRIDQLVTWVALNAYREYDQTYHHFRNGYQFNKGSAKELTKIATAIGLLVLNVA